MERTKSARDTTLGIISEWHRRTERERAAAASSQEMRDFEVAQAIDERRVTVSELSAYLGLSHQGIRKMLLRGRAFKTPPLPF